MSETMADLLRAAHAAPDRPTIVATRSRLAHALSLTGPVLFSGVVYRGTWDTAVTPPKWHVHGDAAQVMEMMSPGVSMAGGEGGTPPGFDPSQVPPDDKIAPAIGVPMASDVPVPKGI